MKKLMATLVVLAVVLSLAPVAMASAANVEFTDFMYLDASENEIPEVGEGLVYTQVTANLNGAQQCPVTLVVMLCEKETGKIKAVDSDTATLSAEVPSYTLKAGVTVNNLSTEEYKYFLWDTEINHTPLDNCEPAVPENISDSAMPSQIGISWDASYDDFDDVASYNLYNNGVLLSSGDDATEFTEKFLDKNTEQNYTIEAVDGAGHVSEQKEFTFKTTNVPNVEMSTDDSTNTTGVTEDGLWLWVNVARSDKTGPKPANGQTLGWTEEAEAGGRACRAAVTAPNRADKAIGRFTAKVDPSLVSDDDKDFIIDITYFDDDTQKINLTYTNNTSTAATLKSTTVSFNKTGTQMWKVASVRVGNANFHYYMDDGTGQGNLRFWQATSGLCVSNIAVAKRSDYDGDAAGLRMKDVPEIRDVVFYMDKAEVSDAEGVACIEIDETESFDFDITDTRLNGVKRVNVDIEYLDEGEGDIVLNYMSTSGASQATHTFTNSGEWRVARIELDNAKFAIGNNLPISTDDLVINATGLPLKIKSIRVYDAR